MDWIELIVHTTSAGSDPVSDLFTSLGAAGTMVEDRADIPDPSAPNGIWEIIDPALIDSMPEDVLVHAWLEPDESFPQTLERLRAGLDGLRMSGAGYGTLRLDTQKIAGENWADSWKKFYKPFRAGKHIVIKPSWESFEAGPEDKIIEIDPGMAFGSGTHETTGMCMALLEENITGGETVIDVGTGSGILAIGAAMTGAGDILAIDIDPDACRVAKENVLHNGVADKVRVQEGNLLDHVEETCDICVANIIADVILFFARPLLSHIRPGGLFICSGIVAERGADVRTALLDAGYDILQEEHKGEWVAFLSRRNA